MAPQQPPSLREAVRMIARLGVFLGRQSDEEPGVQTKVGEACDNYTISLPLGI
jgi:hypothetical protein